MFSHFCEPYLNFLYQDYSYVSSLKASFTIVVLVPYFLFQKLSYNTKNVDSGKTIEK